MSVRSSMTRFRAFLGDLAGAFGDQLRALGSGLRRLWARVRPGLVRLAAWLGPRLARLTRGARAWTARAWSRSRPRAVAFFRRARAAAGVLGRGGLRAFRAARRPVLVALLLVGLTLGTGRLFLHRVPAGVIAVRQVEWVGEGVVERDHAPGLHGTLAGRDAWHELPAGTHLVSFAWENEGGNEEILSVATREGQSAQVAALVPYRIRPGSAWRLVADGLRGDYGLRAVAICRRVLLEELGTLETADLIDPDARARVEASALARLDRELGAAHLEPLDVRLGSTFFNATYEKKLLEKQLAGQGELTRASIAARKVEQRENERLQRELERAEADEVAGFTREAQRLRDENAEAVAVLERDAKRAAERLRSESEVEALALRNEGQLALAAASDLRERLFAEAQNSEAGRLHVARRAAENLTIDRVVLDSTDPRTPSVLDLDGLVELLLGQ